MMIGAIITIYAGQQLRGGTSILWGATLGIGLFLFLKFFTVFMGMSKALRATEAVARKHDLI